MRKVLCSIGAGPHAELLELSGQTFQIYADRHGYELDLRTELLTTERPASWSRILLFQELLATYDVVFWVDADAAIVDPTLDILDELEPRDLMGMVAHEYDGQVIPNCGVWVLRNDRRTVRFLEAVWEHTEYLDHEWWENAAVLDELGYSVTPRVEIVRRSRLRERVRHVDRGWNSIQADPAPHPRVHHYPGRSQAHRIEQLGADLEVARSIAAGLVHPSRI
ncbi:MAG: hypothetical protein ACXVJ7_13340 [Acidimicrobiia bacterium]